MDVPGFDIGCVRISSPLVLAPMVGVTNHAFRLICKQAGGCGLVTAEMISAHNIRFRRHKKVHDLIDWTPEERPVAVQVYGSDPKLVGECARRIEAAGADIIDINMGCPSPDVVSSGSGAALLKDLLKCEAIIKSVVESVGIPVMVKTRTGWSHDRSTAMKLARIVEESGGSAITVHGRTGLQKFHGEADWEPIRLAKENVSIPVIGNGDVRTPEDAKRMLDETGCDGVMIGRAARCNPWIFPRTYEYLTTGLVPSAPDLATIVQTARNHAHLLVERFGEKQTAFEMRGNLERYLGAIPRFAEIRPQVIAIRNMADVEAALERALTVLEYV